MKYLIDHSKKSIHRSILVRDKCQFHNSPIEGREGAYHEDELKQCLDKGYEYCPYCTK
ncbi:hypothetical protein [Geomicrobium sediminis]|uniref:Zinc-finger domain-containing protein n=1 Tax=Geomicrobium sediminis TaxID=1347788 RepID=A0ABS2PCU3_9BACL|nr:hypothetical protein [Geomicrobium sediminis]MBM7633233.1 hypothetical protein [Geomicrobium sediminis]